MANVSIIGGGSVGLLTSYLLSNNHEVTLYVRRDDQKKAINQKGVSIVEGNIKKEIKVRTLLLSELRNTDMFVICVKQPDLHKLIDEIKIISHHTPIIFIQNGMSHLNIVKNLKNPIYIGSFEHGVLRKSENEIQYNGKGILRLANLNGDFQQLCLLIESLNSAQFPVELEEDAIHMLEEKLAVNAVINPLTALFKVKNGNIIENEYIYRLARLLTIEVAYCLDKNVETLWNRIIEISKKTAHNKSSMLQDIIHNKTTEIDAILGYLIKNKKGEKTYITFMYDAIKALELLKEQSE